MINRLFTFGCSNTHYNWPTWADFIGYSAQCSGAEFHNLGQAGTGNSQHLNSAIRAVTELDMGNQPGDVICVMYSSWCREDRYFTGYQTSVTGSGRTGIYCQGNTHAGDWLPAEFVPRYWSLEQDVIRNITAITAFDRLFSPVISVQTGMPFEGPVDPDTPDELLKTLMLHGDRLPGIHYLKPPQPGGSDLSQIIARHDGHPAPAEHLTWAMELASRHFPELDMSPARHLLSDYTHRWDWSQSEFSLQMRPAAEWWLADRAGYSPSGRTSHEYHDSTVKDMWGPGMVDFPGYRYTDPAPHRQGPQRRELASENITEYLKNWLRNKT